MPDRKHYIDNLRALTVLLLFPYHVFMIYNTWGEPWYIHGGEIAPTSWFVRIGWLWMMPILFVVAGISTAYALRKRSIGEYVKERAGKLLVPLVFGVLLIVPVQSYIAGIHFNNEANYLNFFTKFTDLSGYDGGFTPGHLWFILYLFAISMACVPLILLAKKFPVMMKFAGKIPFPALLFIGILPLLIHPLGDIDGKSIGEFAGYFLLGYFILSDEKVLEKLERWRFLLLGLSIVGFAETILTNHFFNEGICREFFTCFHIMALLGLSKRYLNFSNRLTAYLSKSSFGVYVFHQSWIVVVAFFVLKFIHIPALQILVILPLSIVLTFLTNEALKRVPPLRWMYALKN